jgi:hypothetical protein
VAFFFMTSGFQRPLRGSNLGRDHNFVRDGRVRSCSAGVHRTNPVPLNRLTDEDKRDTKPGPAMIRAKPAQGAIQARQP